MARTLPWLQPNGAPKHRVESARTVAKSESKRTRIPQTSSRTPSSSPPPRPPAQERMRTSDAAWVMVEDELLATAKTFTRSLHINEYHRVRDLARRRNTAGEGALSPIRRPTDMRSKMSLEHRAQKLQEKHHARTLHGMRALSEEDSPRKRRKVEADVSDVDEVPIGDRHLSSLMQGKDRSKRKPLTSLLGSLQSRSRAGPPTAQASLDEEEDEHDLSAFHREEAPVLPERTRRRDLPLDGDTNGKAVPVRVLQKPRVDNTLHPPRKSGQAVVPPRLIDQNSEDEDDLRFRLSAQQAVKRPMRKPFKIEKQEQRTNLDDIPLFLV